MYFEAMEYLIFGILFLLLFLSAWDLLTDITDRKQDNNSQESEFAEEL